MADYGMGLTGANNPIFQASQQMNQQSAQMRNAAAEGIVNQEMQKYQQKIGAQLKTYATYLQSRDPFIFKKGAEGMYSIMGVPMDEEITARQQEVNLAYSELSKYEGKIPPKEFQGLVMETLSRFGGVPEGMGERAQAAVEKEALGQAAGLSPGDPLLRAGEAGRDVIKSQLTSEPSLDKILARKVDSGEMTIEQAYEQKRKATPSTTVNVGGADKLGKASPGDYTPESVAEFERTGDYSVLVSKERDKTLKAKGKVDTTLKTLRDAYDSLDQMGAIVNTDKGGIENAWARVKSSGVGQAVGGTIGAKEQSIRNEINQMRPLLINDMRAAADMGARGLDSEKELAFYLQAATDPKRDIQANRAAIDVLSAAYGLGDKVLSAEERAQKETVLTAAKVKAAQMGMAYKSEGVVKGNAPSMKEWMEAARKANPAYSTTELIKIYNDKYKGKK